jgi:hypothetical protein
LVVIAGHLGNQVGAAGRVDFALSNLHDEPSCGRT